MGERGESGTGKPPEFTAAYNPEELVSKTLKSERETPKESGFEVIVDRAKMAELPDIPEQMREWLPRLPERLKFDEKIVLIVGENGIGKTQFARAIAGVLERDRVDFDVRSHGVYVVDDEPAAVLPEALSLAEKRKGNLLAFFFEGYKIMNEGRDWVKAQSRRDPENRSQQDHRLSSRQVFQLGIDYQKENIEGSRGRVMRGPKTAEERERWPAEGGEVVTVFDEPEMGLSPRGQVDLEGILTRFAGSDRLIVPTNNLALYLSDMPRLDLEQPERGVHRPSQYGEKGKIEFHSKNG